jgi:hypothetical protein
MRAMIFGEDSIRRVCGPLTLSVAAWLAQTLSADASIMVRLQQVNSSGNPVNSVDATVSNQTLVFGRLLASGSLATPLVTSGFETVLTWTTASQGVITADLFTVTSSGSATTTSSSALIADTSGFLFADGEDLEASMNVNGLNTTNQRRVFVNVIEDFPTLPSGEFTDIPLLDIRFAVTAGIDDAVFSFTLAGADPDGFYGSDYNYLQGFTSGGGTIAVVPEPGTLQAGLLGIAMLGGSVLRHRIRRRRNLAHATIT